MVHTALPDMDERYGWLSEGLAVYVEPVARVQAGDMNAKEIWAAMARDMPKGLPQAGDQGLDNTDTWGRKYWGGAMFCLFADIEIRKATGNRLGLQDAMRGVLAAGGSHEVNWSIGRILTTADKAVGVDVLTHLHDQWGSKPVTPDLDALWRDLGLRFQGRKPRVRRYCATGSDPGRDHSEPFRVVPLRQFCRDNLVSGFKKMRCGVCYRLPGKFFVTGRNGCRSSRCVKRPSA